jgi:hypothetical protein
MCFSPLWAVRKATPRVLFGDRPPETVGEAADRLKRAGELPPETARWARCCLTLRVREMVRPATGPPGMFLDIFMWRGDAAAAAVPIMTGTFLRPTSG